ncbi:MAG: TIGR01906 family membrane protein [Chloroflexi bacterium]|nr:TIGR01906 family membrane protein [Chloroflexota bacterium]
MSAPRVEPTRGRRRCRREKGQARWSQGRPAWREYTFGVHIARWLASVLFLTCIPIFFVLTNVRIAASWERVYDYAYAQYNVTEVTGIERAELDRAATEVIRYFRTSSEGQLLDIRVQRGEEQIALYNQREILHMADVRDLFQMMFRLHEFAFVYIVAYVAAVYLWSRERSMRRLAREGVTGGAVTVGLLSVSALSVVFGFDTLFEQFHILSFSNDFWQLNPATDRLVQMFPMGFWFDVTLAVGVTSIIQGGVVALMGLGYILWLDRESERRRLSLRRRRGGAPIAAE